MSVCVCVCGEREKGEGGEKKSFKEKVGLGFNLTRSNHTLLNTSVLLANCTILNKDVLNKSNFS